MRILLSGILLLFLTGCGIAKSCESYGGEWSNWGGCVDRISRQSMSPWTGQKAFGGSASVDPLAAYLILQGIQSTPRYQYQPLPVPKANVFGTTCFNSGTVLQCY